MKLTNETQGQLLDCILDMGQLLLGCGAEISRVEDTLSRIGRAYGAAETDVFVITSIISLTMEFPGLEAVTETRRIVRDDGTDFYRLEKLNALSRAVCAEPLEISELRARIDAVAAGRKPSPSFSAVRSGTGWPPPCSGRSSACCSCGSTARRSIPLRAICSCRFSSASRRSF